MGKNLSHLAYVLNENRELKHPDEKGIYLGQDPFWVDTQKILNSKSYRRLVGKTQVFPLAENPLVRNRLTHTMEVYSTAVTLARMLGLNENLAGAIAIGHDLGHAPFGHLGERMLTKIADRKLCNHLEFRHERFSVILAQEIERQGKGLNLMPVVCDGILYHSRGSGGMVTAENVPQEFQLGMYSDKLPYIFSDISDSLRVGYLKRSQLPDIIKFFGTSQREQMNVVMTGLVQESLKAGRVIFKDSPAAQAFEELRDWMFTNAYLVLDEEDYRKALEKRMKVAADFLENVIPKTSNLVAVMATMTDDEVMKVSEFSSIRDYTKLMSLGFWESVPYCQRYR